MDGVHGWSANIGGEPTLSVRGAVERSTKITVQVGEKSTVRGLKFATSVNTSRGSNLFDLNVQLFRARTIGGLVHHQRYRATVIEEVGR